MDPSEVIKEIAGQVSVCVLCGLSTTRTNAVPGEGPVNAEIMFIGEGPGFNEDRQGRPFVGAAGKLLSDLLAKAELKREDVFITNVVKCRPPENRDPQPNELLACRPYLMRQIETINPHVIVTLGRYSMAVFLPDARISSIHGQARLVQGKIIVPMYHPAAALHQPLIKPTIEHDFANLKETLRKARESGQAKQAVPTPQPPPNEDPNQKASGTDPKQMKLF
jgi:uracil-DNA glycosylase